MLRYFKINDYECLKYNQKSKQCMLLEHDYKELSKIFYTISMLNFL